VKVFKKRKNIIKTTKPKTTTKIFKIISKNPTKITKNSVKIEKITKMKNHKTFGTPLPKKKNTIKKIIKKIVLFGTRKPGFLKPPSFFSKKNFCPSLSFVKSSMKFYFI